MRQPFVHTALLAMDPDADDRAPGGAITVALCGPPEHEPPCPLAAHHTAADRVAGLDGAPQLRLRVLFAAEAGDETTVRERIDAALIAGELDGPDGATTRWRLLIAGPGTIGPHEQAHARRLTQG
jgi:hypothetical protein